MKTTVYLAGMMCTVALVFSGCKAKQSAYQQVYEAAQSRSTVYQAPTAPPPATTTISVSSAEETTFQAEKVTAVDGLSIKQYSVVIGSFLSKTNAESLKSRMQKYGYTPVLAQNEKGMYRVLVATFDDKSDAYTQRDAIKERYPELNDAWLLERLR